MSMPDEEKEYNTVLSSIRVKVENVIGKIKGLRTYSCIYNEEAWTQQSCNEYVRMVLLKIG